MPLEDPLTLQNTEIIEKCSDKRTYAENCDYCRKHGLRTEKRPARQEHRDMQRFLSQALIELLTQNNIYQQNGLPYTQSAPKGFLQHPEIWVARQGRQLLGWPTNLPRGSVSIWPMPVVYAVSVMLLKGTIRIESMHNIINSRIATPREIQLQKISVSPSKFKHPQKSKNKDNSNLHSPRPKDGKTDDHLHIETHTSIFPTKSQPLLSHPKQSVIRSSPSEPRTHDMPLSRADKVTYRPSTPGEDDMEAIPGYTTRAHNYRASGSRASNIPTSETACPVHPRSNGPSKSESAHQRAQSGIASLKRRHESNDSGLYSTHVHAKKTKGICPMPSINQGQQQGRRGGSHSRSMPEPQSKHRESNCSRAMRHLHRANNGSSKGKRSSRLPHDKNLSSGAKTLFSLPGGVDVNSLGEESLDQLIRKYGLPFS